MVLYLVLLQYLTLIQHLIQDGEHKRVFRLTSSSTNSEDRTAVATYGEGDYDAKGLLETHKRQLFRLENKNTKKRSTMAIENY